LGVWSNSKQTQSSWLSSLVALANVLLRQSSDYEEEVKGSERLDDGFDLQPDVAMIKKFIKDEELGKKEELRQEEREAQEFNETDRAKNRGVSSGKNLQAT
jgi:hypothetical protein